MIKGEERAIIFPWLCDSFIESVAGFYPGRRTSHFKSKPFRIDTGSYSEKFNGSLIDPKSAEKN
jgi:hypothetical protein